MSDAPTKIGLPDVLDAHRQQILDGINTSQPGKITAYDHATQKASVQPLVMKAYTQEDETETTEPQPIIHDVIVMQWGAKRGRITFPIAVGDQCLLFHASCSIANFRLKGGMVDPKDPRRHDISDTVAVVGLHDFANVPTDAPVDSIVMWISDGCFIKLGDASANDAMVLGTTYRAAEDNYFAALEGIIASIVAFPALATYFSVPPTGAPAVALAAWNTEVTAFHAVASTYLSQIIKVK